MLLIKNRITGLNTIYVILILFYNFAMIELDKRSLAATSLISIDLFSSCY